jgi:hypothetical protein
MRYLTCNTGKQLDVLLVIDAQELELRILQC